MAKKRRLSWAVMIDGRSIWTLNAVPKRSQYGESLRKFRGEEYRRWDPTRSKLGAGLSRARNTQYELLPDEGDTCLYLGAGMAPRFHTFMTTYVVRITKRVVGSLQSTYLHGV